MSMKNFILTLLFLLGLTNLVLGQSATPQLESRPGAPNVFYLDFDGEVVNNPNWYPQTINALPSTLTTQQKREVFNIVVQNYVIFNINVTTKESVYNATSSTRRFKCVITPTSDWYGNWGGVAGIGAWANTIYEPAWVFEDNLSFDSKSTGYAAVHEMGHVVGLNHHGLYKSDQTRIEVYHPGKGSGETSWGPIMGAPYSSNVLQFAAGPTTTPFCSQNFQSDIEAILAGQFQFNPGLITLIPDESTNINNAKVLNVVNNTIADSGLITNGNDVDFYRVTLNSQGIITANVRPTSLSQDLTNNTATMDTRVAILNSSNVVLFSDSNLSKLSCSVTTTQLAAGTYYIRVGASGNPNFTDFCYTTDTRYGSVGKYYLTGSVSTTTQLPTANFTIPAKICTNTTLSPNNISTGGTSYSWNFGSGASPSTSTLLSPSVTYSTAGTKTITLTATNSAGSTSISKTIGVGIPAIPAVIGPNNCSNEDNYSCPSICQGSTFVFTAQPFGDNGSPYTYYWITSTSNNGIPNSGATTQSITVNNITPSQFNQVSANVLITNSFGCISDGYRFASIIISPNATITGPSTKTPTSPPVTFSVPTAAGNTYLWNTGATTSSISINNSGTYSVTVTNSSGCSATSSKTLTVTTCTLQVTISGVPTICGGFSTTLTANPTGGTQPYSYSWSGGGTTQSKIISTDGTYTVTVTSGSCSTTQSQVVSTGTIPNNAVFSTDGKLGPPYGCQGTPFNIVGTGAAITSYLWSPATALSSTTGSTVLNNASVVGTTTYTVITTGLNGCTASLPVFVTVTSLPNSTISGSSTIPSTLSVPTVAGQTYLWSTGATTSSINVTLAGTYSVTVTKNRGNSLYPNDVCTSTGSRTVSGTGCGVTVSLSGTNIICSGSPATTFTATPSGGTLPYTYSWSNGQTTQNISISVAGTYTVTVTDNLGCTASQSRTLTINSTPTVTISGTNTICPGGSTTLTASGANSYQWATIGLTTSTVSVSPSVTTTYTVTGTNTNGCSSTATRVVSLFPSVTPSITGTNSICSGTSTIFTASGGNSYIWSNGSTTTSISITTAATYTVTVTSSNGCSGTASRILTVNQNPTATITGSNTFCAGSSTVLSSSSSTAGSGTITGTQWRLNGTNITGATSTTYSANTAGTYTVVITNSNGCTTVSSGFSLTSNPGLSVSITGNNSICSGASTTFTANPAGSSYVWSNSSTTQNIIISSSGTYSVTVTGANGCSGTASRVLTVNNNPTITITGTTSICLGGSTTLTANDAETYVWNTGASTASISVSPSVNTTYTVTGTFASGCTSSTTVGITVNNNPNISISGVNSICQGVTTNLTASGGVTYVWSTTETTSVISVNPSTTTTYTLVGTNANGCSGTASKVLTVNSNPTPTASNNGPLCIGGSLTINCNPSFTSYSWTGPNSFTSSLRNNTISNAQVINSGIYNLTVTDANGCTGSSNTTAQIVTNTTNLSITSNSPVCIGSNIQINVTGGNTYSWTGPNGFTSTDSVIVINNVSYADTGYYVVSSTASCGFATDSVNITTLPITLGTYNVTDCSASESASFPTANIVSYSWSPSTNVTPTSGNLTPGQAIQSTYSLVTSKRNYILTVITDNGCTITDTIFTQRIIVPSTGTSTTTKNSATLNWSSAGTSDLYQIRYRKQGTTNWTFVTSNINSRQITNLLSNTTYEWQVRAECNQVGTTVYSNFSKVFLFTTKTN